MRLYMTRTHSSDLEFYWAENAVEAEKMFRDRCDAHEDDSVLVDYVWADNGDLRYRGLVQWKG